MIDGESSKAELLQKVFIWRYDCSYSDAYVIKTSEIRQQKDTECVYITLNKVLLDEPL